MTPEQESFASRFWPKVNKDGPVVRPELGQCWVWTAAKNAKGYGKFSIRRSAWAKAHRVSFLLAHGRWPEPCALHLCDNPCCVRPDHLREGTLADNLRDMFAKGRSVSQTKPWLLPHGEAKHNAKLTDESVRAIRESPMSARRLARLFGVSAQVILAARQRKTWKHVV